ncbi:MAG: hypothetical protein NTX24_00455 [Candidatus Pacearchaeota archaeon]|nr:hypothetical protein [Candidatus Pacearchaeota archaeon]
MAKKQKTERKFLKKGMKVPFKAKSVKYSKRDIFALIFALASISLFIITSVYILVNKDNIANMLIDPNFSEMTQYLPLIVSFIALIWIIFAVIMSVTVYKIEKKQWKWHSLFILSILSLITLKIDSFLFGVISSILYIKNHR